MKIKTLKRLYAMFAVNHIYAGTACFKRKRNLLRWAGYEIGENTRIAGPIYSSADLKIGSNCWIGRNFSANGNGSVTIGDNCDIAPDVSFLTGGHEIGAAEQRAGKGEKYHITVGDGTWICARATIGKSITVGSGCVVAAAACVLKDVPSNTMVGGVPAKIIREL
jgi:maltose O-acetyltransferase